MKTKKENNMKGIVEGERVFMSYADKIKHGWTIDSEMASKYGITSKGICSKYGIKRPSR